MLTIKQIQEKLEPMNVQKVAKATGIHANTIYRLAKGGERDVMYSVVKKLSEYLEQQ